MGATLDPFGPATLPLMGLLITRFSSLMLVAPVFSGRNIPVMARSAIIVMLSFVVLPAASARAAAAGVVPTITPATLMTETLIGFALGFGVAIVVAGAELAGELLGTQSGLSGATTLDPLGQSGNTQVLGVFSRLFVITLMLAMDAHLLMLAALHETLLVFPPGTVASMTDGLRMLIGSASHVFTLGITFAAPVTAVILVTNLSLGVLARATPQLNIFMVAYPLQIAVGLFTFAAVLPLIAAPFAGWPAEYEDFAVRFINALGAGR